MLEGKTIVLGVTGSIAAYKAVDIANQLSRAGVKVNVVMTKEATKFVAPLSFRALTGRAAVIDMFDASSEFNITHISLAGAANVVVIAPATANIIAKLAAGIADDVLSCTVLATTAPVVIAPAMDVNMYENPVTQENVSKLKERGFIFVGPRFGKLASGKEGLGRLANTEEIIGVISQVLGRSGYVPGSFADRHAVVTAGSTQEFIDPVRIISNRSSGKMGYALAEAVRDRGAKVTLITGPTLLTKPVGVEVIDVCTAEEMFQAVKNAVPRADVLIMAAAVADYRPKSTAKEKIKKKGIGLTLELEPTTDILSEVKGDFIKVGFAAESENLVGNATQKLQQKGLDLIVANDITAKDSGFGADSNQVTIIDREGKVDSLPLLPKREVAEKILDKVAAILSKRQNDMNSVEIAVTRSHIKDNSNVHIPKERWDLFPDFYTKIELRTDENIIQRIFNPKYHEFALGEWFKAYQVKEGDIVRITPIEGKEKYRVEFLKK